MRPTLRRVGMAAAAAAALTGWARIYVGVHFPLDIVGGVVLALAIAGVFQVARQLLRQWSAAPATPAPMDVGTDADPIDPSSRRLP
jgi:undecaprenyl-diphosphatase